MAVGGEVSAMVVMKSVCLCWIILVLLLLYGAPCWIVNGESREE